MKVNVCTASSAVCLFIIIIPYFLIPFSNANPSVDDEMLIAFMKGNQEMQISEYSKQKYEVHLGILYFMRKDWKCENIADEFGEYERTQCQKYRKHLDILYEYLRKEYVGIPAAKPKFVFKRTNKNTEIEGTITITKTEIEGPIIYAVNCLFRISRFYFNECQFLFGDNLDRFFTNFWGMIFVFQPKLLNENMLNYELKLENEQKLPINEIILQLSIDTANEWPNDGILDGIIRENFDKNLEQMFKKTEEWAKAEKWSAIAFNEDNHWTMMFKKFDDSFDWVDDSLFSEFVKGLATNFKNFSKLTKEYSGNKKENLIQKYEAHIGILYLMKKNWHCDKIGKEFKEHERTECQKYQKYLEILYEYSFGLYVEAKNPEIIKQLSSLVKPIFLKDEKFKNSLIDTVRTLNHNLKCFWKKDENEFKNINLSGVINLVNEKELNYAGNVEKSEENGEKSMIKNENKFNDPVEIANLRREFEGELEKICEKTKENVKEEMAKLEKALANPAIDDFNKILLRYRYKYDTN